MKTRKLEVEALKPVPETVQMTVSASEMPRTDTPVEPTVKTHLADPPLLKRLAAFESMKLK